jgi:hypothetical protein
MQLRIITRFINEDPLYPTALTLYSLFDHMQRCLRFLLLMLAPPGIRADEVIDPLRAEPAKAKHDTTRILILLNMVTNE